MDLAVTLVHAPGAMPESAWSEMRSGCPGDTPDECRIRVDSVLDVSAVSGRQLEPALRRFLQASVGQAAQDLTLSTAGRRLTTVDAGSPLVHQGMVVLLGPPTLPLRPVRRTPLSLCIDSGPDAGQLVPLNRRDYVIGRSRVDVPIADPQISRREAVLAVGSHDVRLTSTDQESDTAITTADRFQLGASTCQLILGSAEPSGTQQWPPPPSRVEGKAPEGRHAMMLAFALVPLAAGIVLVLVTGHWFFLLFSGAGALLGSSIFIHGYRQRRRFHRARRSAAAEWAERISQSMVAPGRVAHLLRSEHRVHSPAHGDSPAMRIGIGQLQAELDVDTGSKEYPAELVTTAVGIDLAPGATTVLLGPDRERARLLRWVLLQLVLSPLRFELCLLPADGSWDVPELRDLSHCRTLTADQAAQLGPPAHSCGVILSTEGLSSSTVDQVTRHGWHVIVPGGPTDPAPMPARWKIDLNQGTVLSHSASGPDDHYAAQLSMDGLSTATLRSLIRLALPQATTAAVRAADLPVRAAQPLPEHLFSAESTEQLTATLGPSSQGWEQLDLVEDGPHVLIAGTTGSGKSELLKTVLLSLCARYGPAELSMVLADFKGGATFQKLSQLEHVLGVVTDLSRASAERTLESIRSELLRREGLFLDAGAGDYIEYRSRSDDPLPRMLVVIDEFRIFAHELPQQLDELMRLATLGRSLGLHLILSTQRPQGVVTAEIRANLGASLALRTRGQDESQDVIGSGAAADIPRTVPGRALLRRPGEPAIEVQTALLQSAEPELRVVPEDHRADPAEQPRDDVVGALAGHLRVRGLTRPHTPLLPPLPDSLHPQDTLEDGHGALLGRIDDPSAQAQHDLRFNPDQAQAAALIGEPSAAAGPSCAAVVTQLLSAPSSSALYLLDGDRSLPHLHRHSRVGAWLTEDHLAETSYLLDQLCEELLARRMGRGRIQDPLVVVVTGYYRWLAAAQTTLTFEHQIGMLASEGPEVGISLLLAGGRELAAGKLIGRFIRRIYLPFGSSDDTTYLWPKLRNTAALPGRGVVLSATVAPPGLTVQLVTEDPGISADSIQTCDPADAPPPIAVRPLPERLGVDQLPPAAPPGVVVGLQQLTAEPMVIEPGPVNLILGSPGTGKSTCLRLLAHQLPDAKLTRPGCDVDTPDAAVLVVDDAHRCSAQQHRGIQSAIDAGVQVIAAAPASPAVFHHLPWAHPARTQGSNVILSPQSRTEAEAFAVMIPTLSRPIPGRAVHLRPEGPVMAQWAVPPNN